MLPSLLVFTGPVPSNIPLQADPESLIGSLTSLSFRLSHLDAPDRLLSTKPANFLIAFRPPSMCPQLVKAHLPGLAYPNFEEMSTGHIG